MVPLDVSLGAEHSTYCVTSIVSSDRVTLVISQVRKTEKLGHSPDSTARDLCPFAFLGLWLPRASPMAPSGPGGEKAQVAHLAGRPPELGFSLSSSSSMNTVANLECGPS